MDNVIFDRKEPYGSEYDIVDSLTSFEFDDVIIQNNLLKEGGNIKEIVHIQAVRSPKEDRVCLKFDWEKSFWRNERQSYRYKYSVDRKHLLKFLEEEISEGVYFFRLSESLLFLMEQKIHTIARYYRRLFRDLQNSKESISLLKDALKEYQYRRVYYNKESKTYIMKDSNTGLYKIGRSVNPMNREKTLQSEKPTIKMIKVFDSNIESDLHREFADVRVRGEWFKLNKVQLKRICTQYE